MSRRGGGGGYVAPSVAGGSTGSSVGSSSGRSVAKDGPATDSYSLGALLRHAATGVPPDRTVARYLSGVSADDRPRYRELGSLSMSVLKAMRGLLNSDVSRRYGAAECIAAMRDGKGGAEDDDGGEGNKVQLLRRKEREGGEGGVPGFVKDEFNCLMTPTDGEERGEGGGN